jgi:hypothetical protein
MLAAVITRQIECLEAAYRVADLLLRPQREDPWLKNISCLQFSFLNRHAIEENYGSPLDRVKS